MNKKKWRDIKNALVMVVVMAAMMSTATYAWFTLTSTAGVTGMRMAAGGSSGLKVSTDAANWYDAVDLRDALANENPEDLTTISQITVDGTTASATSPNGEITTYYAPNFVAPEYGTSGVNEGKVIATNPVASENIGKYAAIYEFYVKTESGDANIGLKLADPAALTADTLDDMLGVKDGYLGMNGSFLTSVGNEDTQYDAKYAVRIGFLVDGTSNMLIWEPNADANNVDRGDYAEDTTGVDLYDASFKTKQNGQMLDSELTETPALFAVDENGIKITMYVWLEGKDIDCSNEIRADQLAGQLEFVAIETP